MTYYSALGHNLKRGIFNFCGKITKGYYRPVQKFVVDMVYGLLAGQSSYLTEIARKLNEVIPLDTVGCCCPASCGRTSLIPTRGRRPG
jgi:hypothetical protein